jgi:ectoine hydroxylase-related dioxygenase (phytanoyl-CoA dioxygenase family)
MEATRVIGQTPTLEFTAAEAAQGDISDQHLEEAYEKYRENGYLVLKNVYEPAYVQKLSDAFFKRYQRYFVDKNHDDALKVGDKRFMINLLMEEPYDDPHLYANALVLPILQYLLGQSAIMSGLGAVVALPGAKMQHPHRDHPPLFEDFALDAMTPSFAVTVAIPLIDLDPETVGTTRIYRGSMAEPDRNSSTLPYDEPYLPVGSVMLFDNKVVHAGTPNRGDRPRPMMYNLYSRAWFRDSQNYSKHPPLVMTREKYRAIPEQFKAMFTYATTPDGTSHFFAEMHGGTGQG